MKAAVSEVSLRTSPYNWLLSEPTKPLRERLLSASSTAPSSTRSNSGGENVAAAASTFKDFCVRSCLVLYPDGKVAEEFTHHPLTPVALAEWFKLHEERGKILQLAPVPDDCCECSESFRMHTLQDASLR